MTSTIPHISVQPSWCLSLPLQQQSVLLLAARGPDGIAKHHPCKGVVRAYRGTVLRAARYGRELRWGEAADSFMSLDRFADLRQWADDLHDYFDSLDALPHHYHLHLTHGAQIAAYKHPDERFRRRWWVFYRAGVEDMHLNVETEAEMDRRLGDWDRLEWEDEATG